MNIAILHYHLNRGGVTQVIRNQLLALDAAIGGHAEIRAAILYGGRKQGWRDDLADQLRSISLELCPVDRLDYDERPVDEAEFLATDLKSQLERLEFSAQDTVLHVHNYCVGKNASLPGVLRILAGEGFPILLQIHDFAEDYRPRNYRLLHQTFGNDALSDKLYPQAGHIHYAVLNRRDYSVLQTAGVEQSRLHFLPNPVPLFDEEEQADRTAARQNLQKLFGILPDHQYALYPVRGIRRKNLGEALLWTILAGESTNLGLTLAPINPAERKFYNDWKNLSAELALPCHFETGEQGGLQFRENLSAADLVLTTSVAEGFGMVFLESWLADRPLVGRNLPEITTDFLDAGLCFHSLYERLDVPVDWVGRDRFSELFGSRYNRLMESYQRPALSKLELHPVLERKIKDNHVDFADLDEPLQKSVIRKVAAESSAKAELIQRNPSAASGNGSDSEVISANKQQIEQTYSLKPSGDRLWNVLQTVASSPRNSNITGPENGSSILDSFLDPARFRLIHS